MKKAFSIIFIAVSLLSCNKKYDSLYNNAPRPALSCNRDTFCIREKDPTNIRRTDASRLVVYCGDVVHELNLQFSDSSGRVHIMYRGSEILSNQFLPVIDSVELFVYADTAGIYPVDCYLTNRLGKVAKKQFVIKSLPNQKPVPSFFGSLTDNNQLQNWGYLFDASISADTDGLITGYHFFINGQPFFTNEPSLAWNFHAKGTHDIALYVTDDLGLSSDTLHQKLTIQ
jgi:hypothetical protein